MLRLNSNRFRCFHCIFYLIPFFKHLIVLSVSINTSEFVPLILSYKMKIFPVLPMYTGEKYYAMPWGNYKPVCEIPCDWEDISFAIKYCNILQKV